MCRVSFNPCRAWWPTIAEPSPLLVQLPQVVSPPAVEKRPSGSEPVRMSCSFGVSPRPLTISPFSFKAVCLLRLLCSECRSLTLFATTTPLAFCHGPLPMRLRASVPASPPGKVVLRYARQFVAFAPAALASAAQCASALQAAEIGAVALAHAGHEERHACLLGVHGRRDAYPSQDGRDENVCCGNSRKAHLTSVWMV